MLRTGPQALPSSSFLLLVCAFLGLITGALVVVGTFGSIITSLFAQLLDLLMLTGLVWGLLSSKGLIERFIQTLTALFGCGVLINLVTMPLPTLGPEDATGAEVAPIVVLLYLVIIIWSIVVVGHIMRHALNTTLPGGIVIAFGYFFMVHYTVQQLFFS
ncbi:MAG: hypothetical protein GY703_13535 [Gammaproteobacteria bacterium]|nr:hypothetical protein [Gammaproteobacteria bacterium]